MPPPQAGCSGDPTIAELVAIWSELFGRAAIHPDDAFFDLGGHSLLAMQLTHRIEQRFGASLPVSAIVERPTIRLLADLVRRTDGEHGPPDPDPFLVTLKTAGSGSPLFFIPRADATPLTYLPLSQLLTCERPLYALLFPDGGQGDLDVSGAEPIAAWFVHHLRRQQPEGPYRLCGHSHGAVLAYEMARQLRASGEGVDLLAMFDGQLPGTRRLIQPIVLPATAGPVGDVDTRLRALRAYRPRSYAGAITLFRAMERWKPSRYEPPGPFNGWDAVCARIEVHSVPGNHLSMMREPNLAALAAALSTRLARD